jgi:hypothetical protein
MSLVKKSGMYAMSMCIFHAAFGMEKDAENYGGLSYIPQTYTGIALKSVHEATSAKRLAIQGFKKVATGSTLCALPAYYYYSSGMGESFNRINKCSDTVNDYMRTWSYSKQESLARNCGSLSNELLSLEEKTFTLFALALPGSIILSSGLYDLGNAGLQLGRSLWRKLWLGSAISQDVAKED